MLVLAAARPVDWAIEEDDADGVDEGRVNPPVLDPEWTVVKTKASVLVVAGKSSQSVARRLITL